MCHSVLTTQKRTCPGRPPHIGVAGRSVRPALFITTQSTASSCSTVIQSDAQIDFGNSNPNAMVGGHKRYKVPALARHLTGVLCLWRGRGPRHADTGAFRLAPLHDGLLDMFLRQEVVTATRQAVLQWDEGVLINTITSGVVVERTRTHSDTATGITLNSHAGRKYKERLVLTSTFQTLLVFPSKVVQSIVLVITLREGSKDLCTASTKRLKTTVMFLP